MMASCSFYAVPQGLEVVHGTSSSLVPIGGDRYSIECSDKTILHWRDFSILSQEEVVFHLPSAKSAVLNRVIGNEPTELLGQLLSNGRLFVVNPHGVLIGPNARIEAASFIASTLDVLNESFLNGDTMKFFGESKEAVINLGKVSCPFGSIALIGRAVRNEGTLSAPDGKVGIGVGSEILLQMDDTCALIRSIEHPLDESTEEGAALYNTGDIEALIVELETAENPYTFAIQQKGLITSKSSAGASGTVRLAAAEGICEVDGKIDASSQEGIGGTVHVLGEKVGLLNTSSIDVSGGAGGGTVLIGGDYQGKNPNIKNALFTFVGKETTILAGAHENGNGGRVIIWSDASTQFYGTISARGGAHEGNGGFVEISGKKLDFSGFADRTAPNGKAGTLLLDPIDVRISAVSTSGNVSYSAPNYSFTSASPSPAIINGVDLQNNLSSGPVNINTSSGGVGSDPGTITVLTPINWAEANTLTLIADQNILVYSTITNTNPTTGFTALHLQSKGLGSVSSAIPGITVSSAITTNGGDIVFEGQGVINSSAGSNNGVSFFDNVSSAAGTITFQNCIGGGNNTSSNYGLYILGSIDAPTIIGTNIRGGANGVLNNYGVYIGVNGSLGTSNTSTINITAMGGGGDNSSSSSNAGVYLISGTIQIKDGGTMTLFGTGGGNALASGSSNTGIRLNSGSFIAGANSTLSLQGVGGSGSGGSNHGVDVNMNISLGAGTALTFENCQGGMGGNTNIGVSLSGAISIVGGTIEFTDVVGGGNGTGTNHYGVHIDTGANISAPTITGTGIVGGNGLSSNYGFYLEDGVFGSSSTTTMSLTANGGTGVNAANSNYGFLFYNGTFQTAASSTVTLIGTGGGNAAGAGTYNYGINFYEGNFTVGDASAVSWQGTGGAGSGGSHTGVNVQPGMTYSFGENSTLTVENCLGGTGTSAGNVGFYCNGTISLSGATSAIDLHNITGGTGGSSNYGVRLDGGSLSAATITATDISGGDGTTHNFGIVISRGVFGGASTNSIDLTAIGGHGSAASSNNYGFFLTTVSGDPGGTLQVGTNGSIRINGTAGGNAANNGTINYGVYFAYGFLTTGAGSTITLEGTGGVGTGGNHIGAVILSTANYSLGDDSSLIFQNCQGGSGGASNNRGMGSTATLSIGGSGSLTFTNITGGGSGTNNYGIHLLTGALDAPTITATNVTGGMGTADNYGIYVASAATVGASTTTSLNLSGTGGGSGSATTGNHGITIAGTVQTGSTGSLALSGIGGNGTSGNDGVLITGSSAAVVSENGDISISGTKGEGSASFDISIDTTAEVASSGSGDLTFTGIHEIALGDSSISSSSGNIRFAGPVTMIASSPTISTGIAAGNITFDETLDGAYPVLLSAGNTLTFSGAVGNLSPPTGFTTTANSFSLGDDITTANAAISMANPITLIGSSTLTSGNADVTLSGTIDALTSGEQNLTLDSGSGTTTISGIVGGSKPLGGLSVTAGSIALSDTITTSGAISFNGLVVTSDVTNITNSGAGNIAFSSTLTAGNAINIAASASGITIEGNVIADGSAGNPGHAVTMTALNDIILNGDLSALGGSAVLGNGQSGGSVSLHSTGGNVRVNAIDVSGSDGVVSGGDGGSITLQPATTCVEGALGCIPDGRLFLLGNLTSMGGSGASQGSDGNILLSTATRSAFPSIATIISSFSGNNLTVEGGTLTIGSNESMTILGDLTLSLTGEMTTGDLVALNTMVLTTPTYTLLTHGNETILLSDGSLDIITREHVIAENLTFDVATFYGNASNVFTTPLMASDLTYIPSSYVLDFDTVFYIPPVSAVLPLGNGEVFKIDLLVANAQLGDILKWQNKQLFNRATYLKLIAQDLFRYRE